jgi:hypothetical protein
MRDRETQLSRAISLARRVREKPSLLSPSDKGSLANILVSMGNVASDDVDDDGLGGRWDDEVYPLHPEARLLMKLSTSGRGSVIAKEILSRRWGIGLESVKKTLQTTTQAGIRRLLHPAERHVGTMEATRVARQTRIFG